MEPVRLFGRRLGIDLFELDGKWMVRAVRGDRRWLKTHWVLPVGGDLETVVREVVAISETADVWDDIALAKGLPHGELLGTTNRKMDRFARWSSVHFVWYEDGDYWRRWVSPSSNRKAQHGSDDFVLDVSEAVLIAELLVKHLEFSPNSGVSKVQKIPVDGRDQAQDLGAGRSWLVARVDDPKQLAKTLGLRDLERVTWSDGLVNAERSGWFISPVIDGWVLCISQDLDEEIGSDDEESLHHYIKPLSRKLKTDVQVFHWDVDTEGCVGAWANAGKLVRIAGFGWEGEGTLTPIEHELFAEDGANRDQYESPDGWLPRVAKAWGVDVTTLSQRDGITTGWEAVRKDR